MRRLGASTELAPPAPRRSDPPRPLAAEPPTTAARDEPTDREVTDPSAVIDWLLNTSRTKGR